MRPRCRSKGESFFVARRGIEEYSGPQEKRLQTLRLVFGGVYVCVRAVRRYNSMSIITFVYNIIRLFVINIRVTIR